MWHLSFATTLALFCYGASASNTPPRSHSSVRKSIEAREIHKRNVVYDGTIADSYDFVICGGGLAGLVLASRLSEDSNHTVLVLEAGDTGDAVSNTIDHPGNTYWSSLGGTSYSWPFYTTAQSGLASRDISWPRGKVLGGSSATNGMYLVRPSESEITAWHDLIASDDEDAASVWTWDSFFATMKSTETFGAPTSDVQSLAGIQYDTADHGTAGPIHHSYPGYEFGFVGNWTETLENYGVAATDGAYGGTNLGAYVANSAINPSNWTRSYSRAAYIDPLPYRSNLDILANATCTKINWDTSNASNITATSVSYAASADATASTVTVNKEVILSGGTVGSPQLLLVSGVGPSDVITGVGLDVVNELPGVGQHLQDHLSAAVVFSTSAETAGAVYAAGGSEITSDIFLSYINSATAYINATTVFGSANKTALSSTISSLETTAASTLVPSTDTTVLAGYKATYEATQSLFDNDVAQVELLQSITGDNIVMIQAAIQHPYSRGHLYINSSSIFDLPLIDPGYLSHSADVEIIREALKIARQIGNTAPLSTYLTGETSPGSSVQTDDEWNTWASENLGTEYHPTGSCSMLPKSDGGVVDAKLMVYGTTNVRVIDASVYPIEFSSHLGAPTYATAELGAQIIRSYYNSATTVSSSSASAGVYAQSASASSPATTSTSGAIRVLLPSSIFLVCIASVLLSL